MAYIIGLLSPEEEAELKRRGWTVELAPNVDFDTGNTSHLPHRMRMVWIDQDMFTIMDGPDWDKGSLEDRDPKVAGTNGDNRCEAWWNRLAPEQRLAIFAKVPLHCPEQAELFSRRLWHELHGWMRDELRSHIQTFMKESCLALPASSRNPS
jgi:hypothetical protein